MASNTIVHTKEPRIREHLALAHALPRSCGGLCTVLFACGYEGCRGEVKAEDTPHATSEFATSYVKDL